MRPLGLPPVCVRDVEGSPGGPERNIVMPGLSRHPPHRERYARGLVDPGTPAFAGAGKAGVTEWGCGGFSRGKTKNTGNELKELGPIRPERGGIETVRAVHDRSSEKEPDDFPCYAISVHSRFLLRYAVRVERTLVNRSRA